MDDHTVTGRIVAVLDAVAGLAEAATLAALTRSTGIPKPTVRRIAVDLVARGFLKRCGDTYRLGPHLLELGVRAAEQQGLRRAAAPYLQDLFARTREVVWVGALSETAFTVVDCAFGANRTDDLHGHQWPTVIRSGAFLATAAGRVLLAERPELVGHLRSRPLPPATRYTITSWPRIDAALDTVRGTGVAIEQEQATLGYSCITVGLRGPDGGLIGVLGITGRTGSFAAERLTRPMRTTAGEIARIFASGSASG